MISRRGFLTLTAASASAGMLGAANAFAVEPGFGLTVKQWTVVHPDWPTGAALRIGVLTDIHAVEPWMNAQRIGGIVERLNAEKPDLIVLLGDYVNGLKPRFCSGIVPVNEWMAPLAELRAPLGVYAVLGNHDCGSAEVPLMRRAFHKAGIALLENNALKMTYGKGHFWLAGLRDQLCSPSAGVDDLRVTLVRVRDDAPVILLAHEPEIFSHVPQRVALTLSGHTHGGQVYIPFIGRPALDRLHFNSHGYGHFVERGRHLVVSSGLGLSGLPVRFMVPPEIALVKLHSSKDLESPQSSFNASSAN
jgi:predicted MPP superfamily phosphohydrolase